MKRKRKPDDWATKKTLTLVHDLGLDLESDDEEVTTYWLARALKAAYRRGQRDEREAYIEATRATFGDTRHIRRLQRANHGPRTQRGQAMRTVLEWIEEIPFLQEAECMEAFVRAIQKEQRTAIAAEIRALEAKYKGRDNPDFDCVRAEAFGDAADIVDNWGDEMTKKMPVAARVGEFLLANRGKWFWAATIAKQIGSTVASVEAALYRELRSKTRNKMAVWSTSGGGARVSFKNMYTIGGEQESAAKVETP